MLKTFRIGGVHPPEHKISAGLPIQKVGLPTQLIIPLAQNLGAPSIALVKKGDEVKTGTLIAKPGGFVGANIHASASGVVAKIDDWIDASGYRRPAIFIDVHGDEWESTIDKSKEINAQITASKEEIITKIADAGIVGLGGATFPTQVKLTPPPGNKADCLIINAVECEPYLTSDHQLMLEKGAEILVGVRLLMKAIGVVKAYIGVENNKADAIEHLRELAVIYPEITIVPLKVQYPQGGEKQLIDAVIGRQVPSGALPIAVGAVVQNVGTAYAVYEAVQKNKPLFERVVTVTGKAVSSPGNFLTRIGTPIQMLIDIVGGIPEGTEKIISGGPMMGKSLVSTAIPIVKGCSGVLFIPSLEAKRNAMSNCIRCAKCVQVCPMGLEPYWLMNLSEHGEWERTEREHVMDCIECGCCSFTCPSSRPLLDYIRLGKNKVGTMIRNRKK